MAHEIFYFVVFFIGGGFMSDRNSAVSIKEFKRVANKVSIITIIENFFLFLAKLLVGLYCHSTAIISDAIHSASDVFSTIVVMIGVKLSSKESDKEHPYGHERLECIAALVLSMILFLTGAKIGMTAISSIIDGSYLISSSLSFIALIVTIVSIIVKELMFWYTRYYAKKIDSNALMADAWHHRSDSLSSIGALIGIIGCMLGYPIMDSLASLVIFIFIAKAAYDIFKDAVDKLIDKSCDKGLEEEICDCILSNSSVIAIDLLQSRVFGNRVYIDLEIQLDGNCTLNEAHSIAQSIHDTIELEFPNVKHIMVHTNPN